MNGRDSVAFIKLKPSKKGGFYTVNTAFETKKRYVEKKIEHGEIDLLWSETDARSTGSENQSSFAPQVESSPRL